MMAFNFRVKLIQIAGLMHEGICASFVRRSGRVTATQNDDWQAGMVTSNVVYKRVTFVIGKDHLEETDDAQFHKVCQTIWDDPESFFNSQIVASTFASKI